MMVRIQPTHKAFSWLSSIAFSSFAPSTANPKSLTTLPLQKVVFVLCNLVTLGVGLWKCRSMGLLPVGTGDWLAFETRGLVRTFLLQLYIGSNVSVQPLEGPRGLPVLDIYRTSLSSYPYPINLSLLIVTIIYRISSPGIMSWISLCIYYE